MNRHDPGPATEYERDFYAWTQRQGAILRSMVSLRAGLPDDLDLAKVAEEIEDLGKSDLRGASSLIRNIMVHLIKIVSDPRAQAVAHWREEVMTFHADLPSFYTPSMRRLIDVHMLWRRARSVAEAGLQQHERALDIDIPVECPYALADFLAETFDLDWAVGRLLPDATERQV